MCTPTMASIVGFNAAPAFRKFRNFAAGVGVAAVGAVLVLASIGAATTEAWADGSRGLAVGSWATGHMTPLPAGVAQYTNQTLREVVRTSIGGHRIRVRIANTFGTATLHVGAVHIALAGSGSSIVPGTDQSLTFGGSESIDIPAGAVALSDAVHFRQNGLTDVAVSIYLPGTVAGETTTFFQGSSFVAAPKSGNQVGAITLPGATALGEWPFLFGIDVPASDDAATVVAFADSATIVSQWPNALAERLAADHIRDLGVVSVALAGNRLLHNSAGPTGPDPRWGESLLTRFERDVLGQPGVKHVIVWIGLNDIAGPGAFYPASEVVSQTDLIAGFRQLIARAHEKGLTIQACTISPMGGNTSLPGFDTPEHEAARVALNDWIRASGEFDGVVDADLVLRDPAAPTRLRAVYDSGDHLHPNLAGGRAIAKAIDLRHFERR
ncbi:MAG TPA: GDSL-type esterase/lipase family protein [Burkholderiales bacterium]|nr:GDSL-type esterase/lipase family protein [Burkholderiales bacterium]